jgi:hypothetical protein
MHDSNTVITYSLSVQVLAHEVLGVSLPYCQAEIHVSCVSAVQLDQVESHQAQDRYVVKFEANSVQRISYKYSRTFEKRFSGMLIRMTKGCVTNRRGEGKAHMVKCQMTEGIFCRHHLERDGTNRRWWQSAEVPPPAHEL